MKRFYFVLGLLITSLIDYSPLAAASAAAALIRLPVGASYESKAISNMAFTGFYVDRWSFESARLNSVVFQDCELDNVSFESAVLNNVVFQNVVFTDVSFESAVLNNVKFVNVRLAGRKPFDTCFEAAVLNRTDITTIQVPDSLKPSVVEAEEPVTDVVSGDSDSHAARVIASVHGLTLSRLGGKVFVNGVEVPDLGRAREDTAGDVKITVHGDGNVTARRGFSMASTGRIGLSMLGTALFDHR